MRVAFSNNEYTGYCASFLSAVYAICQIAIVVSYDRLACGRGSPDDEEVIVSSSKIPPSYSHPPRYMYYQSESAQKPPFFGAYSSRVWVDHANLRKLYDTMTWKNQPAWMTLVSVCQSRILWPLYTKACSHALLVHTAQARLEHSRECWFIWVTIMPKLTGDKHLYAYRPHVAVFETSHNRPTFMHKVGVMNSKGFVPQLLASQSNIICAYQKLIPKAVLL